MSDHPVLKCTLAPRMHVVRFFDSETLHLGRYAGFLLDLTADRRHCHVECCDATRFNQLPQARGTRYPHRLPPRNTSAFALPNAAPPVSTLPVVGLCHVPQSRSSCFDG